MNYGQPTIDVRVNGSSRIRVQQAQNGTAPALPVQGIPDDDDINPSQVY